MKRYGLALLLLLLLHCWRAIGQSDTTVKKQVNIAVKKKLPAKSNTAAKHATSPKGNITSIPPTVPKQPKPTPQKAITLRRTSTQKDTAHKQAIRKTVPIIAKDTSKHVAKAPKTIVRLDSVDKSTLPKIAKPNRRPSTPKSYASDTRFKNYLSKIPYINWDKAPIYLIDERHESPGKEWLFYPVCGLLLLFGMIRSGFPKYFSRLFEAFASPVTRLRPERDSQAQNNLPSLLLNFLFCISVGLTSALLLQKYGNVSQNIWLLWAICTGILILVYFGKFLVVSAFGWIFNARAEADTYNKVVFLVNKIIGLAVLPLLLILGFTGNDSFILNMATITAAVVVLLLGYRYLVSIILIGKNMQGNVFHFFIYLCAVEVLPILILYKLFINSLYLHL